MLTEQVGGRKDAPAGFDELTLVYATIGKKIRELRKKRNITQAALASLISLTRVSIVNIERGRQKFLVHTLMALARALQVPAAELLSDVHPPTDSQLDALLQDRTASEQAWIRSAVTPRKGRNANRKAKVNS